MVCQECLDLVLNVEKFALRCVKVNEMFIELAKGSVSDSIAESLRWSYGLCNRYEFINCEIGQLEAKSEPLPENSKN